MNVLPYILYFVPQILLLLQIDILCVCPFIIKMLLLKTFSNVWTFQLMYIQYNRVVILELS